MLPPVLVEQRLLDFCVGGVRQLSKYIVVPKIQEMWKDKNVDNFAFSFLTNCRQPLVPSLENRATFCSSPLPKQTAKFPK